VNTQFKNIINKLFYSIYEDSYFLNNR
jgi:hypothetical protein